MNFTNILRYFAPAFFIICAGLRCYLETGVFGKVDFFTYYTLLHHVLWYMSAMLAALLTLHLILSIELRRLIWLFYGAVVFFVPILYALFTGGSLELKYLDPEPLAILKDSLSACFLHPKNKPQFLEIILIDSGVLVYCFFLTRSIKKAIFATLTLHAVLTLFGIRWFYSKEGSPGVIAVSTNLENHIYFSMIWLFCATVLVQAALIMEGVQRKREVMFTVISGLLSWWMAMFAFNYFSPRATIFDLSMTLLPFYGATAVVVRQIFYHRPLKRDIVFPIQISLLAVQLMVAVPVWINSLQAIFHKPVMAPF